MKLRALLIALLVTFGVPADRAASAADLLEVTFLDVGQADATLLTAGEVAVLIDTGDWRRTDVVDHLAEAGVDRLDLLVVTHPHSDHIGQFDRILDSVDVDKVWWSGATTSSQTFGRAVAALEASDAAYLEPRVGHVRTVGELLIEVVNPPAGVSLSNIHDSGLAARVTFGETRWLFTGDIEAPTEQRMIGLSAGQLDADVYQVGHHGSSTSTTPAFLDAVDPAVAVYSAGAGNQYGHPHAEVLDRLDTAGVHVFGTDVNGTVTATSHGTTIEFVPEFGEPHSYTVTTDENSNGDTVDFSDVAGTTHEQAILAVARADIAGGFPDGTYRPGQPVTRGQMATFLTRALDLAPSDPPFADAVGTTHAAAIGAVAEADIAGGFPDDTYRPGQPVTRGQMATFLTRGLGLLDPTTPPGEVEQPQPQPQPEPEPQPQPQPEPEPQPEPQPEPEPEPEPQPQPEPAQCVDLNSASWEELQEIIHIGPDRADEIIARRPWASVANLTEIPGIGPARLADIIEQGFAAVSCA